MSNKFSLASKIKLNNGIYMPQIHLGVYLADGKEAHRACGYALESGYRAVDSAQMYHNEADCGKAIQKFLDDNSSVKREDIWYTTKLASNSDYDTARKSIEQSVYHLSPIGAGRNGFK